MTSRVPLPLRLVQCDLRGGGISSPGGSGGFRVLTAYKPSGLPCYAASQVSAAVAARGDGRRLCAIHTRHAVTAHQTTLSSSSSSQVTAVEAGPQPLPDDPSDSLLSRVVDASLPGCTPYVALPVVSQLLRHGGGGSSSSGASSDAASATSAAQRLNQWSSRHKGLVLVTGNPSDALFLRNAAQLDLVQRTYRVSCRLPVGVAAAARRYLQAERRGSQPGGHALSKTRARVVNAYVQAHRERRRQQQQQQELHGDLSVGIPLVGPARGTGAVLAADARLPASVHPHPLVSGGFFDAARGQLRVCGTLRCFLRVQTPLAPASAARVEQRSRLHNLFATPMAATGESSCTPHHPWLPASWRLGVSLDAPHMQCEGDASSSTSRGARHVPAPRGKVVRLEYRLLSLSPLEDSDVALYEVHTRGDTTADEVAAIFAAEGLHVVNDVVQDVHLAAAVEEVAARMRVASPPALLHALPLGLQHRLRTATAEELVALPLTWIPLEDADRLTALHTLHQLRHSSSPGASSITSFTEDTERLRHLVQAASGKSSGSAASSGGSTRHPLQQLLLHALSTLQLSNAAERGVYESVMALTLGSGVECIGCVYPDPVIPANVHALQQLWLTYEQQRQRQPSLADAARAARLHPLASSLQYTARSALDEPVGLTHVPLLTDLAGTARGECSFTHALTLLTSLAASPASTESSTAVTARAYHDVTEMGNAAPTTWAAQTEVPEPHEAAYRTWCASTAATASASAVTSLWPAPSELVRHCNASLGESSAGRSTTAPESGASAATSAPSAARSHLPLMLPVRLVLRAEELADARCAHCGKTGHTWQHCVNRLAEMAATLPYQSSPPHQQQQIAELRESASSDTLSTQRDDGVHKPRSAAASQQQQQQHRQGESVTESEGIFSVEDAAALLASQASDAAHQRHLKSYEDGGSAIQGDTHSCDALIPVPNVAATLQYKAGHALRREARKPAVHRRVVRCVYCGGRHHVTACPTLQAQNGEAAAQQMDTADASTHASGSPLFCIACGQTGHLYTRCRTVPAGLHHATHCPICRQPRTSSSHSPTECPQRVMVPDGYEPSGMPALQVTEAGAPDAARASRSGWSTASATTPREPRRHHTRRRKGSVLIADSFVDSK